MLAQAFLTSAELGITDAELDALIKVLGMLERQEVEYAKARGTPPDDVTPTAFNMGWVFGVGECGTTACLCGWAKELSGDRSLFEWLFGEGGVRHPINGLFLTNSPIPAVSGLWDATPNQAAIALRNHLTTGEPRWSEALAA